MSFPNRHGENARKSSSHIFARPSRSVCLVTAADKLDNVRSLLAEYRRLGESLWSDFRGGRSGTLWYARAVVEALRQHSSDFLVEELDRAVSDLERLVGASQLSGGPEP